MKIHDGWPALILSVNKMACVKKEFEFPDLQDIKIKNMYFLNLQLHSLYLHYYLKIYFTRR